MGRGRRAAIRLRAVVGLAIGQFLRTPSRSTLAVLGVTLAVLSTTLLAGTGLGVVETGERQFDAADRDLWVTAGPAGIGPQGGFDNAITGSHEFADELEAHEGVRTAIPIGFQTVYVSADGSDFETIIGAGVPGSGPAFQVTEGDDLSGDQHYAGGSYDGPKTNEVVIDERTAEAHDVSIGDSLYLGGTLSEAREQEYEVVGISQTFSQFLGAPTVTLHLSELQQTTGTTGTDPSTFVIVTLEDGTDVEDVQASLAEEYPEYEIRTNAEQLEAVLETQAHLLAAGGALVALAIVAGLALTANILTLLVHQQRRQLAALKAIGLRSRLLVGLIAGQGFLIGVCGGLLGLALTIPAVRALDTVTARLVGFEGLVQTPTWVLGVGLLIAIGIGVASAAISSWRVLSIPPLNEL